MEDDAWDTRVAGREEDPYGGDAGLGYVKFTLSSLTRSKQSVAALMDENDNSIANSAHLRGKTFDISYAAFGRNRKQLKLFTKVLKEMRSEGLCYVKYERNGCLHMHTELY